MNRPIPESVDELLAAMVQIDSVNSAVIGRPRAESGLGDYLELLAGAWQIPCRRLPVEGGADNLLLEVQAGGGGDGRPWLLFDSHMDTVSAEGMTIDPFGAEIREGRLYGRGSCDTKGTGAAMLWALKQYIAVAGPNHIGLLFSVDEEVTMTGIRSFMKRDLPALDIRPSGMIVGEPTMLRSVTAHNGVVRWRIATVGKAAHSSVPQLGCSAIRMMSRVIETVESNYIAKLTASHPQTGKGVCSITKIHGGSQENIIPERCEITLDRRLVPGEHPEKVLPAVQSLLDELLRDDAQFKCEQIPGYDAPPLDSASNQSLTVAVRNVLEQNGLDPESIGVPFCTHAGIAAQEGLPAVVLGPGDPRPAHTKDEWVDLEQIRKGAEVYQALMAAAL